MSREFAPYAQNTRYYDIGRDFDNIMIDDGGELDIGNNFRYPFHVKLGESVLKISLMPMLSDTNDAPAECAERLYHIQNLDKPRCDLLVTDELVPLEGADAHYGSNQITIGRRSTPELALDESVDDEHLLLRFGALQRNVHLTDISSTHETIVAIHVADNYPNHPRIRIARADTPYPLRRATSVLGRWLRTADDYDEVRRRIRPLDH